MWTNCEPYVSKVKAPQVVIHPSLQEFGETLASFDYAESESKCRRILAEHALLWAHLATQASVEGLTVSRLSGEGKLAARLILQVRALRPSKKCQLQLAPAFGDLTLGSDSEDISGVAHSQVTNGPLGIHDAMLAEVPLHIFVGQATKTSNHGKGKTSTHFVRSPLLGKSAKKREEV